MIIIEDFAVDKVYGKRLLINKKADQSELKDNIRVARVLLDCFDMNMANAELKTKKIVSGIFGRHNDFTSGSITECYMVHNSKAVVVKPEVFAKSDKNTVKRRIEEEVEKLRT